MHMFAYVQKNYINTPLKQLVKLLEIILFSLERDSIVIFHFEVGAGKKKAFEVKIAEYNFFVLFLTNNALPSYLNVSRE